MSLASFTRFVSVSITPKTCKIFALRFTTSLADKLYTLLQLNSRNTEKALNSIKVQLDTACINKVLNKCSHDKFQMGLRFFVWAGYQSNYKHSSYMYSKACRLLRIKQNPKVIIDLIETYRVEKFVICVKTFKVILCLCREGGLANEALLVLRKMPEFDIRPNASAYNDVIRLFCDKGDMDMAQRMMGEMGFVDLFPDMITYTSMIKGFCKVGRLEEACGLFNVMRDHGCAPNVVTYSALLDGICRFGSVERALELLREMEKEVGVCRPNVVTYTSVIQSFCKKGRTMDALPFLDRMEACGCAPNRVTISTLIEGLCMDGHLEEAYKLIDRVVVRRSVSYSDCYSSLVVCLIRIKKAEEAEKLFRRVLASGVKPDSLACSIMIREICFQKRILDGFHLYDEIEKMGCLSSIDSDIYSILLVGLCEQGHLVEAGKLARSMLEKSMHLKAPYIDKLMEDLKKSGNVELVRELASICR